MRRCNLLVVVVCAVMLSGGAFAKPGGDVSLNGVGSGKNVCDEMLRKHLAHTGNPFDIAVYGQGFLVTNDGVDDLYSGDGSFAIGPNYYLTDPLTGYNVQRTGTVGEEGGFQQLGDMNIAIPYGMRIPGKATTSVTVSGHIALTDMQTDATQQLRSPITYNADGYNFPYPIKIEAPKPAATILYPRPLSSVIQPLPDQPLSSADMTDSRELVISGLPSMEESSAFLEHLLSRQLIDPNLLKNPLHRELVSLPSIWREFEWARIVEAKQFDGEFGPDGATGKIFVSGISRNGTAVFDQNGLVVDEETMFSDLMDHIEQVFAQRVRAICDTGQIRVTDTMSGFSKLDMLLEYVQSEGGTDSFQVPEYFEVEVGGDMIWNMTLAVYGENNTQVGLYCAFTKAEGDNQWDLVLKKIDERFYCQPDDDSQRCQSLAGWPAPVGSILVGFDAGITGIPFDGRRIEGINFNTDGSYAGMDVAIGDVPEFFFLTNYLDQPWSIVFDFGEEGVYTGLSHYSALYSVFNMTQDGYQSGELVSSHIYGSGQIVGTCSNGVHVDIATIKLVDFDNVCGLEKIDDRYYLGTEDSGLPREIDSQVEGIYISDRSLHAEINLAYHAYSNMKYTVTQMSDRLNNLRQAHIATNLMLKEGDFDSVSRQELISTRKELTDAIRNQEQARDQGAESLAMIENILISMGYEIPPAYPPFPSSSLSGVAGQSLIPLQ